MSIHSRGDAGWVAASATVTKTIGEENYASYLEFIKKYLDRTDISAEQKLLNILRGGTNTVYELRRGKSLSGPCALRQSWSAKRTAGSSRK